MRRNQDDRTVGLPRILDDLQSLLTADFLMQQRESPGALIIDFSPMEFAHPFGILILAATLKDLISFRKGRGLRISYRAKELSGTLSSTIGYLGHIGFFRFLGIDHGKAPGQARGGERYLPLTLLSRKDFADVGRAPLERVIQARSRQLAKFVASNESKVDMISYCLQEVIRNVFEHANVDDCCLLAQRFANDTVEIAILDRGIGIRASLETSYKIATAGEAIRMAISPGISRVRGAVSDPDQKNAGFGLYVLSRIGRDTGEFRIATRGASLYLAGKTDRASSDSVPGTVVKMTVDLANAEYFPNQFANIIADGERAQGHAAKFHLSPSKVLGGR